MELWRKVRRIYYGIQEFRRILYFRFAQPKALSFRGMVGVGVHRAAVVDYERTAVRVVLASLRAGG